MGDGDRAPARWWLGLRLVLAALLVMVGLTIAAAGGLLLGGFLAALGLGWTAVCLNAL